MIDWPAKWLSYPFHEPGRYALPVFSLEKSFALDSKPANADAYVSALGVFKLLINGVPVSQDELQPGWTDYKKVVYCRRYQVGELLREGDNEVKMLVGEGWYSGHVAGLLHRYAKMSSSNKRYGKQPFGSVFIQGDNGKVILATEKSWDVCLTGIESSDILLGEVSTGDDNHNLTNPLVLPSGKEPNVELHPGPPIRRVAELEPVSIERCGEELVVDFGQNFAGKCMVSLPANSKVIIKHGEALRSDGSVMTDNLFIASQTDTVTSTKGGWYTPLFTYHGFRYASISGLKGLRKEDIRGIAMSSALRRTGQFECSNAVLNKIYSNVIWTQLSNTMDVLTDCPQRDERMGWTGDALLFFETAAFNFDVRDAYRKWLIDVVHAQRKSGSYTNYAPFLHQWPGENANSPIWSDAGISCPYWLWLFYGDLEHTKGNWDSMMAHMGYVESELEGFVGPMRGFGDWVSVKEKARLDLLNTCFARQSASQMATLALALGKNDDHARLSKLANDISDTFEKVFVYGDGILRGQCQAAYAVAAGTGVRPALSQSFAENLASMASGVRTGFVGTKYLLPVLSAHGHHDKALHLATMLDFPSWGYSVANGATTIWERWDSYTKENGFKNSKMNSFNHFAFGSIGEWMYKHVLGISPVEPGFKKFRMKPGRIPGFSAAGSFDSPNGKIAVEVGEKGGQITVPPGTTCDFFGKDVQAGKHSWEWGPKV